MPAGGNSYLYLARSIRSRQQAGAATSAGCAPCARHPGSNRHDRTSVINGENMRKRVVHGRFSYGMWRIELAMRFTVSCGTSPTAVIRYSSSTVLNELADPIRAWPATVSSEFMPTKTDTEASPSL